MASAGAAAWRMAEGHDICYCVYQPVAARRPNLRTGRIWGRGRNRSQWDYGQYEGLRLAEILRERPDWQLFRDGCPGGESPTHIGERADRVVERVPAVPGNVLLPAGISFGFWQPAGWRSVRDLRAGILC